MPVPPVALSLGLESPREKHSSQLCEEAVHGNKFNFFRLVSFEHLPNTVSVIRYHESKGIAERSRFRDEAIVSSFKSKSRKETNA